MFLRFSFDFSLPGVPAGSEKEVEFSTGMQTSYLSAVRSTLQAIRNKVSKAA
ncbi:hypothetical protein D3C87_1566380 [compost metagenome]